MNFRSVLYIIGLLISALGCMMLIPAMFDLLNNNKEWSIFASTGIISFLMGITIILAFRNRETKIGSKENFSSKCSFMDFFGCYICFTLVSI